MDTLYLILDWAARIAGGGLTLAVITTPIWRGLLKRLEVEDPGERRAMLMGALKDGWRSSDRVHPSTLTRNAR